MASAKGEERESFGERKKGILLSLLYLVILFGTLWAEIKSFQIPLSTGEWNGHRIFYFFTNDSNIFCALTALLALPVALRRAFSSKGEERLLFSPGLMRLRLAGCVVITLTFWTVLLFLGPVFGYGAMYYNEDIFLHVVGPVLEAGAFLFLERGYLFKKKDVVLAAVPMLAYTFWYVYETILERNITEFYGFTRFVPWPLAALIMIFINLFLGMVLAGLHNRLERAGKMVRIIVKMKNEFEVK